MPFLLKITNIGNSAGIVLPKDILNQLRVDIGDSLYVIETQNGIELVPYSDGFATQLEAVERVMHEDRVALRKLAD